MSATLDKVFPRGRNILATGQFAGDTYENGGLMKADTTNFPAGFPKGLVVVATTEGGESGFLDPYLQTPLAVDISGTWTDDTDVDSSTITSDIVPGTTFAKQFDIAADHAAGDLISTTVVSSTNYSGSDFAVVYVKSSVALDAGDVQIGFSATASLGGSPVFDDIPAIEADVWTPVSIPVASLPAATISFGLKQVVDKGAYTLYLGFVRAFTATTGSAAVGVLGDDVIYSTLNARNINGESGYEAVYFSHGTLLKKQLIGLDSGAETDLDGTTSANGTIFKY